MTQPMADGRFEVRVVGVADGTDELGVWRAGPTEASAEWPAAAYGDARDVQRRQATIWLADLPADHFLARRTLAAKTAQLADAERALPDAARRLSDFVRQSAVEDPLSFAVRGGTEHHGHAEQELARWVSAARADGMAEEASFSLLPGPPAGWQETTTQVLNLFQRVQDSLRFFARVVSMSEGRGLASTEVGWTGNFRTTWSHPVYEQGAEHHADTLGLALRTRAAWLRMAFLIARGSAQLGLLFPTNPVLAMPAAWKFFNDVLKVAREMNQSTTARAR